VLQNSKLRSIRAVHSGGYITSAVRRPSLQRTYIREVSRQTTILRLQGPANDFLASDMSDIILSLGFLFFGTITHVEDTIRSVIEGPSWQQRPVQFLVLDMSLVRRIDMSSAEAFVCIHRLLSARCVTLVFCGFEAGSRVGKALNNVEVIGQPGVKLFSTLNGALECE
jgi:SulP family sulfate permease